MNKVMVAGVEVIHGLSNMNFHSPRPTWLWPLLNAHSASSKDQNWVSNKVPFPRVISQLPYDRFVMLDCFYYGSGTVFFLTEIETYCGYGLAFPECNASGKTDIHELIEFVIHCLCIPHNIAPTQQKRCGSWLFSWNSLVLPRSSPSWCSWLDRTVEKSFMTCYDTG